MESDSERGRESAVLGVDVEPEVLSALARILRDEPYEFLRARSGTEALELVERFPVKVVITDERMPEMSGSELLDRVREKRPGVGRIILTGFPGPTLFIRSLEAGGNLLMGKPWNEEALKFTIRNLIRKSG
jgi:DNA-binding response OmpR family regulator